MGLHDLTDSELVDGWRSHVDKFHAELDRSLSDSSKIWHLYDWIAALHIRSAMAQRFAGRSWPGIACEVDDLFRSFTVGVGRDWIPQHERDSADGWWWSRLPRRGPVLEDWTDPGWLGHHAWIVRDRLPNSVVRRYSYRDA